MLMPEWKKTLILVAGLAEILVFSGTILGWTSLKLMLKKEGIYDYKCKYPANQTNATLGESPVASALIETSSVTTVSPVLPTAPMHSNFSLRINFTFINNGEQQTDQGNHGPLKNIVVIPFESPHTFNQSFIYTLLRDPQVTLKTNTTDAQIFLLNDAEHNRGANISTLEEFIHLYLEENLEVPVSCLVIDICHHQLFSFILAFGQE